MNVKIVFIHGDLKKKSTWYNRKLCEKGQRGSGLPFVKDLWIKRSPEAMLHKM